MSIKISWLPQSDFLSTIDPIFHETPDLESIDPYGVWGISFGAPFDLLKKLKDSSTSNPKNPQDYQYTQRIFSDGRLDSIEKIPLREEISELQSIEPSFSSAIIEQISGLVLLNTNSNFFSNNGIDFKSIDNPENISTANDIVFRLPLKKSSINPENLAQNSDAQINTVEPAVSKKPLSDEDILAAVGSTISGNNMLVGLESEKVVITGIIDDAINIAHENFTLTENGKTKSRVDFAWIQDAPFDSNAKNVPFGRELTRADIENAIAKNPNDDEAKMIDLGVASADDISRRSALLSTSHGTHILDLAAGYTEQSEGDANATFHRIVSVQLPSIVTQDTSGSMLLGMVHHALHFIFNRAKALSISLNKPVPVVINFSYGMNAGPHNGNSQIEKTYRKLALEYRKFLSTNKIAPPGSNTPVELVMPAGNQRQAQSHAQVIQKLTNKEAVTMNLPWRLQPNDQSNNFLEVWLPENATIDQLKLTSPSFTDPNVTNEAGTLDLMDANGLEKGSILLKNTQANNPNEGVIIGRATIDSPFPITTVQGEEGKFLSKRLLIALAPTEADTIACPSGLWKVDIQVSGLIKDSSIHAWIQRDDTTLGYSSNNRASYFDDPDYENNRFDEFTDLRNTDYKIGEFVTRYGTVSGIATRNMDRPSVDQMDSHISFVGGYQGRQKQIAPYSGAGSAFGQHGLKISGPNIIAVTDRSKVLQGITAAGTKSGTTASINGTSVGAPQVARLIAQELMRTSTILRPDFNSSALFKPDPSVTEQIFDNQKPYTKSLNTAHGDLYAE